MLILAGSHVNYKTHEKMTPLHFAASRGFIDLVFFNITYFGISIVMQSSLILKKKKLFQVKILVNHGSYLEGRDTNERTALYLASGRGHIEVVKYLISYGANVNGEEIHGMNNNCSLT